MARPGRLDHRPHDAVDADHAGLVHVAQRLAAADLHGQAKPGGGDHLFKADGFFETRALCLELGLHPDDVMVFAQVVQLVDHLALELVHGLTFFGS